MIHAFPPAFFKNVLCFLILFSSLTTYAQEKDSLQQYSYEELDSLYFENFHKDLTISKKYAELLFRKATEKNNYNRAVKGLLRMSVIESELRNFNNAHIHIDKAMSIIEEKLKDKPLKNKYLLYKGNIYYTSADYDKALEYYTKSYEYQKETNNIQNSISIAHNIAMIKSIIGNYDEALTILKENYLLLSAEEEKQEINFDASKLLSSLIGLSDTYVKSAIDKKEKLYKTKLLDTAEYYNEIGLKKCLQYEDEYRHVFFLIRKAKIAHEKENYQKAIFNLNLANTKAKKIKQQITFSTIYFHLGKNYQKLEQLDNAILFLRKADSISETDTKQTRYSAETYLMLTDLYIKKKDQDNALKYHKLFIEIDKATDKQAIDIQKRIYKNYDIPELNDKIKKLINTTKEQESKYVSVLVALVSITLIFIVFFVYNRNKQKNNRLTFEKLIQELEIKKKEVLHQKAQTNNIGSKLNVKPKSTISIDDEKVNAIVKALEKFEQKKQFLDINCDLAFVAKKVKTNKAYLSKVIHTEKQQKFIQYITNLRIDYALEKLKEDKLFRSYDIKSIASELGFKSPDSFSRAFKNKTGIYPSYYIKNINKINTSES